MNGKTLIIFIVSVAFFTLAATYRFHDSAHAMGMIKQGGGVARHPALLDKDRDSYVLIATAAVVPPYHGNARVVLEGDPTLTATFHNSEPVVDIGIHRHPTFRDNTYFDLRPRDRVALWVKIKRGPVTVRQHTPVVAQQKQAVRGTEPVCTQCESEGGNMTAKSSADAGSKWRGKKVGSQGVKGPAVAFYDVATNGPLLRIPIQFADGAGGGDDDH
ncbi:MAG: hypothetical protein PHY09_07910 [Desulfuromonadaceae bacterium]|nr:hypothetical protein [Desulfuromonadaceae bacterium]MDD5106605.1 hypothetical protein [Desulfuromonadaceae bacterium]